MSANQPLAFGVDQRGSREFYFRYPDDDTAPWRGPYHSRAAAEAAALAALEEQMVQEVATALGF